jgi:hypothetical protein
MTGQQVTRSAVTDATLFQFSFSGRLREITASLTGFTTQTTKAELTSGENLRVDFR